jgi:hypothetical protein
MYCSCVTFVYVCVDDYAVTGITCTHDTFLMCTFDSFSNSLRNLGHEYVMHETLRDERFYVREALAQVGPMLIMKHGGRQTLDSFMRHPHTKQQLQANLLRAAYEIFSCIQACHKHQIVHRVSTRVFLFQMVMQHVDVDGECWRM